jgi:surfactin synthase thioesterase subunit
MGDETVVIRPLRRDGAARVLVCLGFCGGGTAQYRPWASWVPEDTDLALVCYPGREGRFLEGFATTWEELAVDALRAVRLAADRPYTLFGHSMGGWMAFDVAGRAQRSGGPIPAEVVVSACNAPAATLRERDRFPAAADTEDDLIGWMRQFGALPDYVLADPGLMAMALELMRADIRVRDSVSCNVDDRIDSPLHLLFGSEDEVIEDAIEVRWSKLTSGELRVTKLPGGHFYTPRVWERLTTYFL